MVKTATKGIRDLVLTDNGEAPTVEEDVVFCRLAPVAEVEGGASPSEREDPNVVILLNLPEHLPQVFSRLPSCVRGLGSLDERTHRHLYNRGSQVALLVADRITRMRRVPDRIPVALGGTAWA